MNTIRNITGVILMFSLVSCSAVSTGNHSEPKTPVDQPRIFKNPLFDVIYKDIPIIDKRRDDILDRMETIEKMLIPEDRNMARILIDTEYAMYLAFHVAIASGDQEAADHYKGKLFNIYEATRLISNKYAIPSGGDKNEF